MIVGPLGSGKTQLTEALLTEGTVFEGRKTQPCHYCYTIWQPRFDQEPDTVTAFWMIWHKNSILGKNTSPMNLLNWNSSMSRQDLKEVVNKRTNDPATNPRRIFVSTKSVL